MTGRSGSPSVAGLSPMGEPLTGLGHEDGQLLRRRPPFGLIAAAALAASIALLPLAYLVIRVTEAGPGRLLAVLTRLRTWEVAATSVGLALAVAATAVVLGSMSAWLVARSALPATRLWAVALVLPLAMPTYVIAYAFVAAIPGVQGFAAAWLVLTLCTTPYVALPVLAALRSVDATVEEVARSCGASAWVVAHRITWPQVRPAVGAGALLVGLYVLSDFGAVSILRVDTFTRAIYTSYRAGFDRSSAAILAAFLVVLALVLVWLEARFTGQRGPVRGGSGVPRPPMPMPRRWLTPLAVLPLAAPLILAIGLPVAVLVSRTFAVDTGPVWSAVARATVHTLGAGALGVSAALLLAVPVGILLGRYRVRGSRFIASGVLATHALPGVVVGLALVLLGVTLMRPVYQTLVMLALAYGVLFMAKAVGSVRAGVERVPWVLEEVARSQGCTPREVWRRVTLPIAAPGVVAGAVLVLLTVMKELPATLLLRPTGFDTLATQIWSRSEVVQYGAAAPYALALVCVAVLPAWWLSIAASARGTDGRSGVGRG